MNASLPPPVRQKTPDKYAIRRLMDATQTPEAEATRAYVDAQCHYETARRALQKQRQEEAAQREEWEYNQAVLTLRYDAVILPALRRWIDNMSFDPIHNFTDAFFLWQELIDKGVSVSVEKEGTHYRTTLVTNTVGASWRTGNGISDVFREALILAWWDTYGETYE